MMKWIALAGAVLAAIGGIGMASVHATGMNVRLQTPWHLNLNTPNAAASNMHIVNKTEAVSANSVTVLQIETDTAIVHITPDKGKDVSAHLYGRTAGKLAFSVTKTGSEVRIILKRKSPMDFGLNQHINLDVTVPQKTYRSLAVQNATGEVDASNLSAKQMDFHLSTGALTVEHMRGNLVGTTNTGAISVTDVSGSLNLTANTGKIAINEPSFTHDITAKTNTGEVTIHADTPPKNLNFSLNTSIGSVTARIPHAIISGGRSNVSGTVGSGGPVITGQSDIGAVTLTAR